MSVKAPPGNDECVKVMVRARPMNTKERNNGSDKCIEIDKSVNSVILHSKETGEPRQFTFDAVYDENST